MKKPHKNLINMTTRGGYDPRTRIISAKKNQGILGRMKDNFTKVGSN